MKILSVETFPYGKKRVIIRVTTDEGVSGWGDATPLTSFTGETQGSIMAAIENYLKPTILNENPLEIGKLSEKLNKLPWNMAAKAGIEMALFDIAGKVFKAPVYSLLGGKHHEKLLQAIAIGKKFKESIDEVAREAEESIKMGFQLVKVKIGRKYGIGFDEDYKRVQTVADTIRGYARFWVDCQAAYSPQEALKVAKKIEKFDPIYIEQPTPDIEGMAEVRRRISIPLLADESVFSPRDALEVIRRRAADAIGIKFAKCGGILAAKKISEIAEAYGLECIMISPGETNIGLAAYLHVAASSKNISICNFPLKPQEDWLTPLEIDRSRMISVPKGAGLGIEVLKEVPKEASWEFEDFLS
jgi:L-alanine-DL-glutamate epimerase-like enolase superfamily enzyme